MVFGNCGVLTEITKGKGFVEMSGIDPDTSTDIGEVLCILYNFDNIFVTYCFLNYRQLLAKVVDI